MALSSLRSLTLAVPCLLFSGLALFESESPSPTASSTEDERLETAMQALVPSLKALSRSLGDPAQNEASLAALTDMQKQALAAKDTAPANLDEIPEAEREAHTRAFRADMARLLRELCEMEIEVCEGNNDAAKARVRSGLIPLRNASHEKYQKE